jgi:hypothetical protein
MTRATRLVQGLGRWRPSSGLTRTPTAFPPPPGELRAFLQAYDAKRKVATQSCLHVHLAPGEPSPEAPGVAPTDRTKSVKLHTASCALRGYTLCTSSCALAGYRLVHRAAPSGVTCPNCPCPRWHHSNCPRWQPDRPVCAHHSQT